MRTLVLTPHAELLPYAGHVIFAGGWCLTGAIRKTLVERKVEYHVAVYPWDNRTKYHEDYGYVLSVYESFLEGVSASLNKLHGEGFDKEYWRILAGPALYAILCHLLDRWRIAESILANEAFDQFPCFQYSRYAFTPFITADLDPNCHEYNHFLLQEALLALGFNAVTPVDHRSTGGRQDPGWPYQHRATRVSLKSAVRSMLHNLVGGRISERGKIFIVNSYLPRVYELALNLIFLSFPISATPIRIQNSRVRPQLRENLDLPVKGNEPFDRFASSLLPRLLPRYLVEDYSQLGEAWRAARWPHAPRIIYTANAYQFNEVFQHYAATKKATTGAKLIIGQHGGTVGILKWSFGEDHQLMIADKFISWGWTGENTKVIPGFVMTNLGKKLRPAKKGRLLLTTAPMRRYSHKGGALPVGPNQAEAFLSNQLSFYRHLSGQVAADTVLRITEVLDRRFGSEYIDRWRTCFPEIVIDRSTSPIGLVLKKTRLFVYTYNGTGFLETLSANFPTVMFWDPNLFEVQAGFGKALDELERVKLFHRTPESAAAHINQVWHDVGDWWSAPYVQRARAEFSSLFARQPPTRWMRFFKDTFTN